MTEHQDELLSFRLDRGTAVAENLRNAVEAGSLLQNENGTFELPPFEQGTSSWLDVHKTQHLDCVLSNFLFKHAYAESAVPFGCKECYKVIVTLKTLKQLMALKSLQEEIECTSKCGIEVDRATTQSLYSGFFYCIGLDKAREIYKIVRAAITSHPSLGCEIPVHIKRGCTHFEISCGPSDQYEFKPELPELEDHLKNRFKRPEKTRGNKTQEKLSTFALWIQTAYRIGDDTYLEFTGGKRLYPKLVTYDPDPTNKE